MGQFSKLSMHGTGSGAACAPHPLDFGSRIVGDKGALIYLDCVGGVE